jgi:hypothetical protein
MKTTLEVRQHMAEIGYEFTPKQISWVVSKLAKLNRRLRRGPELEYMSLEDKQDLLMQLAEQGQEVTMDELESYIELAVKVRELEF